MTKNVIIGTVISNSLNKSVVIQVEDKYPYFILGKRRKRRKHFMAHDEKNICSIGDIVLILETFRISKKKYCIIKQILVKYKILNLL